MKRIKLFEELFSDIKIEIIDYNFKGFPIMENLNTYEYKENGRKLSVLLTEDSKSKIESIKSNVDKRLLEINDFEGKYTNKHGQVIKRMYNIRYSNHWLIRFLRKDIEDPSGYKKIEEPDVFEGIDLIYNNRDRITELIDNRILQDGFRVLAKARMNTYEIVFELEKSKLNKKLYRIYFISQIKGLGHNFKDYIPNENPINRTIKL